MPLLTRNVDLGSPLKLSSFRKVAIGTWRDAGDPSVYTLVEYDVTPVLAYLDRLREATGEKITMTHFVGKAAANVLGRHPELNCILRFGKLYPRKSVDIFFQVASDDRGDDLSGTTIRGADKKSIVEIAQEMREKVLRIRQKGDPDYKKMKGTMRLLPGFLTGAAIHLTAFLNYTLNLWTPLLGIPRDSFGSVMVTSIGMLGLDMAFAPLVPYSRVPCLIAVGAVRQAPVVRNGEVVAAPVLKLGVTFDHRLIDGVHGSKMAQTLNKIFQNPEAELGPPA